ncbi:MAG: hypothetical protein QG657_3332, partial [Acidobacteriota bacterium]|nr:hypothetical protein [Acidobacteriota bacterium]
PSSQRYEVNKEFDLFFNQVKSVTLSQETVLLGSVRVLRIVPDGNFWVLDSKGIKIHKYKPDGTFISSIGGSGQGPGEYLAPRDIFIGKEYIYVVDDVARKLNVLNMDENFKYFFIIQDGRSVQESKTGDIVIAAPLVTTPDSSNCIQIYTKKGELKRAFVPVTRNALKNGLICDFVSFSLDEEDNIYCVQEMEYKIYKYSFSGQLLKSLSQIKPYYTSPPDTPFKQKHLRSAVEKWHKSWTHVIGIIYYNKLLFVTLLNPGGEYQYIIDIYSTEGEFIKGGLAANYRLLNIDKKGQFYFLEDKIEPGSFEPSYNILIYSMRDSRFVSK